MAIPLHVMSAAWLEVHYAVIPLFDAVDVAPDDED
jgi:hypothetical protein